MDFFSDFLSGDPLNQADEIAKRAALDEGTRCLYILFDSFMRAGFNEAQAMMLIMGILEAIIDDMSDDD